MANAVLKVSFHQKVMFTLSAVLSDLHPVTEMLLACGLGGESIKKCYGEMLIIRLNKCVIMECYEHNDID